MASTSYDISFSPSFSSSIIGFVIDSNFNCNDLVKRLYGTKTSKIV